MGDNHVDDAGLGLTIDSTTGAEELNCPDSVVTRELDRPGLFQKAELCRLMYSDLRAP